MSEETASQRAAREAVERRERQLMEEAAERERQRKSKEGDKG